MTALPRRMNNNRNLHKRNFHEKVREIESPFKIGFI